MKLSHKVFLCSAGVLLLLLDAYAFGARLLGATVEPVDWLEVVFALMLQSVALSGGFLYARFVGQRPSTKGGPSAVVEVLRPGFMAVLFVGLLAAYSVRILYNAVNCGSQPIPTKRGNSTCARGG